MKVTTQFNSALEYYRVPVRNKETGELSTLYLLPTQLNDSTCYVQNEVELERVDTENELLSEWLAVHYKDFGA